MNPFKTRMLTTTVIPIAMALGVGASGMVVAVAGFGPGQAYAQCNPCAAKNPCNPCAAANPCNPCAAVNPCNPCAAGGHAAAGTFSACVIPRLAKASICNPCAAKNPCNPCAAKNPCNPCAVAAACNPCAAKNPCNPCAAKNPCNPCAAANPCNPCAAANPCNPCGAGAAVELTDAEAAAAYDCISGQMRAAYGKSGDAVAAGYLGWQRYSRVAYQSATHGERYVQNYANAKGRAYGAFEKAGRMPVGATLAKDSFAVTGNGHVAPGPLFIMEKMAAGFNRDSGDWKYTMIMPNGSVFGETKGRNTAGMRFCFECHMAVDEDQDSMMLLPDEYRVH